MKKIGALIIVISLLVMPATVLADEIADQIKQALKFYQEGKISAALEELNFAAAQLRQKKAESLFAVFPKAPEGFTAEKPSSQAGGAAMLGGGISATQVYRKSGGGQAEIKLMSDSPLLQTIAMMMSNPMFMQGGRNGKLIRVAGHKAILKSRTDERAQLQAVVGNKVLVEVSVSGVPGAAEFAKKLFAAMDMAKLKELTQ